MRLRHNPGALGFLQTCPQVVWLNGRQPHDWASEFGNDNPLHLEIGAGKGDFAIAYARANPAVNLVAVERSPTVAAIMARKVLSAQPLANLRIVVGNATELDKWFAKGKVSAFLLNFSDPWPKKRHAHNRLTHIKFIALYRKVGVAGALVTLKTDNQSLYDFTMEHLAANGIAVHYNSNDFYQGGQPASGEVTSEYERKFCAQGAAIKKIVFQI